MRRRRRSIAGGNRYIGGSVRGDCVCLGDLMNALQRIGRIASLLLLNHGDFFSPNIYEYLILGGIGGGRSASFAVCFCFCFCWFFYFLFLFLNDHDGKKIVTYILTTTSSLTYRYVLYSTIQYIVNLFGFFFPPPPLNTYIVNVINSPVSRNLVIIRNNPRYVCIICTYCTYTLV